MPCHHALAEALRAYIDAAGSDAVLANQCLDAVMSWNADRITDRRNPPPPVGMDPHGRPKYTWYQTKDDKLVLCSTYLKLDPTVLDRKVFNFVKRVDQGGRKQMKQQSSPQGSDL